MVAEIGKKTRLRAVSCDFNGIIVNNFDSTSRVTILLYLRRFLTKLKGSLNILCGHLCTVVELNALFQMEDPLRIAYNLIRLAKSRLRR